MKRTSQQSTGNLEDPSNLPYLDEDEQEQIVKDLKGEQKKMARQFQVALQVLGAIAGSSLFYCLVVSLREPWVLHHQQRFQGLVPSWSFLATYLVLIFSVWCAVQFPKCPGKWHIMSLCASFLGSFMLLIFWGWIFFDNSVTSFLYLWLPCGGLIIQLVAIYIDREIKDMVCEIQKLEGMKYKYKSL
mmetsp:Transcript_39382/g.50247  ORF Transcript_39382/g.50247 Transcript_39382/m.50247 type:complete len:187 (-) Transcript_39382:83-643(-)